jgi:hypothetical protein
MPHKSALPYVQLRGTGARKPVRVDQMVAREHKRVVRLTARVYERVVRLTRELERTRRALVRARLRYATLTHLAADLAASGVVAIPTVAIPEKPQPKRHQRGGHLKTTLAQQASAEVGL